MDTKQLKKIAERMCEDGLGDRPVYIQSINGQDLMRVESLDYEHVSVIGQPAGRVGTVIVKHTIDYGKCPHCGEPVVARERRENGNDQCSNGHVYPSSATVR